MWFTKTYASSNKTDHMKLLHYTELMVSQAETEAESDQQQMATNAAAPQAQSQRQSIQSNGDSDARDVRGRTMDGIRTGVCAAKPPTGGAHSAAGSHVKSGGKP